MPIFPASLLSRDAQIALTEFRQEFANAFAADPSEQTWPGDLGLGVTVRPGGEVRFPIPIDALGYQVFEGDIKYQALAERSLKVKTKLWQAGVSELARVIEAPDFLGWAGAPARIALAGQLVPNTVIAELLEDTGQLDPLVEDGSVTFFDGTKFDDGDHPFNIFDLTIGTFGNKFTKAGVGFSTIPGVPVLKYAAESFRKIKNPQGLPAGYKLTHVFAPPSQERTWMEILDQQLIVQTNADGDFAAVDNLWKGKVKLVIADQLSDDDKFYTISANKQGNYPWMWATEGAPEEIVSDKTSEMYKTKLKVGVAYIMAANGALALPHTIQQWSGEP